MNALIELHLITILSMVGLLVCLQVTDPAGNLIYTKDPISFVSQKDAIEDHSQEPYGEQNEQNEQIK